MELITPLIIAQTFCQVTLINIDIHRKRERKRRDKERESEQINQYPNLTLKGHLQGNCKIGLYCPLVEDFSNIDFPLIPMRTATCTCKHTHTHKGYTQTHAGRQSSFYSVHQIASTLLNVNPKDVKTSLRLLPGPCLSRIVELYSALLW